MMVLSPTKILQNPVQDPAEDHTGTYRMIVLSPSRILQNPVQDPAEDHTGTYRMIVLSLICLRSCLRSYRNLKDDYT